jgi:hypothetical protein
MEEALQTLRNNPQMTIPEYLQFVDEHIHLITSWIIISVTG